MVGSTTVRLLERSFRVDVPLEEAWAHVARVEQWPSWARHIRRVELRPAGPLGASSAGTRREATRIRDA
jgi:hypothetical protein